MTCRNLSLLAGLVVLSSFAGGAVAQQTAGLLNQALQHRDKGNYSSAITDFQQAVRLDPENASLWNYLCSTQIMAGKIKEGRHLGALPHQSFNSKSVLLTRVAEVHKEDQQVCRRH